MSEQSNPLDHINSQNMANWRAVTKAQAELDTAVAASKRFIEDNNEAINDLAKAEDQARFPSKEIEPTLKKPKETHDFVHTVDFVKNVYGSYDHEKYKDLIPYPAIQLALSQKAIIFKELEAQAKKTYESFFGSAGSDEFGTAATDYMTDQEINAAREGWLAETETTQPVLDEARRAVETYYSEHKDEIDANRKIMDAIGLKEQEEELRQRRIDSGISSYEDEEQ